MLTDREEPQMNESAFEQQCLTVVRTLLNAYLLNDREKLQNTVHLLAENFVFIDECNTNTVQGWSALVTGSGIYSYHALNTREDSLYYFAQRLNSYSCVIYGFSATLRCSCICSLSASGLPLINSMHLSVPFDPVCEEERRQDSLTGLLNRRYTESAILYQLQSIPGIHLLFMVDLDNFKYINDYLGHPIGDDILTLVAQILRNAFGKDAAIGRVGGDEFLILTEKRRLSRSPEETAQAIIGSVTALLKGYHLEQSCSVGIISVPSGNYGFDALYRSVDKALYTAKASGKAKYFLGNIE